MKKTRITILSLVLLPLCSIAQIQSSISIGGAVSYANAKNTEKYLPVVQPNASLTFNIPITNSVSLQTGLMYSIRGYNTVQKETFEQDKSYYLTQYRMRYLSIPLMLSVKTIKTKKLQVWADGGMHYNFFLSGSMRYDYENYKNNELVENSGATYRIKGWFTPSKYSPTRDSYDMNALDIALKLQMRFMYKDRYLLAVYHEYSLYDIRSNPDNAASSVKAQYTGISLGYRLF